MPPNVKHVILANMNVKEYSWPLNVSQGSAATDSTDLRRSFSSSFLRRSFLHLTVKKCDNRSTAAEIIIKMQVAHTWVFTNMWNNHFISRCKACDNRRSQYEYIVTRSSESVALHWCKRAGMQESIWHRYGTDLAVGSKYWGTFSVVVHVGVGRSKSAWQ